MPFRGNASEVPGAARREYREETVETPQPEPTSPRPSRRRMTRRIVRVVWILFSLTVLSGVATALGVSGVAGHLSAARAAMQKGRSAFTSGNLDLAAQSFQSASSDLSQADAATHGVWFRLASFVPIIGRDADIARDLTHAAQELAAAGTDVTGAVRALPGGLASLTPTGGGFPLEALSSINGVMASAAMHADRALAIIRESPSSWLLPPVAAARSRALDQATSAATTLDAAHLLLQGLPSFAGADGARHYFFGAEDPAELRGTGGLIGAYSIITMKNGHVSFGPFHPVSTLPDLPPNKVPPPNPDYRRNYDQYGGAGFWQNMNMTPDFPSAARAILATYERVAHSKLDGVITADPFALQTLIKLTGRADVPGIAAHITAGNVVAFTANRAFTKFSSEAKRKEILGAVAAGVFKRFLNFPGAQGTGSIRALARTAADGHIKVFSTDLALERGLVLANAAGSLERPSGDYVSVIANSGSGSKVDFYVRRTVSYSVKLGADFGADATTDVQIQNDSPTSGEPQVVIGPNLKGAEPGDEIPLLTIYCGPACQLVRAERNGTQVGLATGSELGVRWYRDYFTIPAGGTGALRVQTSLEHVWTGNSSGGEYHLTFVNQTTINPTDLVVNVTVPSSMHIISTTPGMEIVGQTAMWKGIPGRSMAIDVTFQPGFATRILRDIARPFP